MLNPRRLNSPAMRARTPNLFSTRTESVWRMEGVESVRWNARFVKPKNAATLRAMITLEIPPGEFAAYIFDCDGTLADTMPLHHQAYLDVLRPMGYDFPEALFYSLGGVPAEGVLEVLNAQFGWAIPVMETAARKEARFGELIPRVRPIVPVVEFMRGVLGKYPVAVASGGMKSLVLATLQALGIHEHFTTVVTYEDVANPKPAPDTYLEAARRMGVEPARCLVFEDTPLGIRAATAAGMRSVLVPSGPVVARPV